MESIHTIWKGAISFGLVSIPVKMYSATEEKDISMKYIHKECGSSIHYVKSCQRCSKEVPPEEIVRGYEFETGKVVLFEKDELDQLSLEKNKEIRILDFVDFKDIDPVYFQKTYYLGPGETSSNAYMLLLKAMTRRKKIGIARVFIRSKSSLAAIRVLDNCIAMNTIFYADEVRHIEQVPNLPNNIVVSKNELQMAEMLIDQLSGPFQPDKYHDEYRVQLLELIHKKVSGEEVTFVREQPQKTTVIDLMGALQASLDAIKVSEQSKTKKTRKKEKAV